MTINTNMSLTNNLSSRLFLRRLCPRSTSVAFGGINNSVKYQDEELVGARFGNRRAAVRTTRRGRAAQHDGALYGSRPGETGCGRESVPAHQGGCAASVPRTRGSRALQNKTVPGLRG